MNRTTPFRRAAPAARLFCALYLTGAAAVSSAAPAGSAPDRTIATDRAHAAPDAKGPADPKSVGKAADAGAAAPVADDGGPSAATDKAPRDVGATAKSKYADVAIRSGEGDAQQKSAPTASPANSAAFDTARVALALGVVIAIILALRWLARRLFGLPGGQRSSRAIQVLTRSVLSPKQQLLLIQVGRRVIVAADSGGHINSLCEISDADELAALVGQLRDEKQDLASKAFGNLFSRTKRGFESAAGPAPALPAAPDDSDEAEATDDAPDDIVVTAARGELDGLRERVRLLSSQFKTT